MRICSDIFK